MRAPALPACHLLQNARSVGGGACGQDLRIKNNARRVVTVGPVDAAGQDKPGKLVPPGVTLLAKVCAGHVWRARDAAGRVLVEHRVQGGVARASLDVVECMGRRGAAESGRHGAHVSSAFMGGAFSLEMGTLARSNAGKGASITFVVKAALAHLWSPRSEMIKWTREAPCPVCEGRGAAAEHVSTCPVCSGSGVEHEHATVRGRARWANGSAAEVAAEGAGQGERSTVAFGQKADARCSLCDGYGETPDPKHICRACKGMRMLRRGKAARTDIPAGAPSDWSQVFEGEGHAVPGGTAGDVVVKLEVEPHPNFTRVAPDSPDLEVTLEISLQEALLGFQRNVSHPLGHNITVESTEISSPDDMLLVPGEGLPVQGGEGAFGDVHVTLDVSFPQSLHGMQRQSLRDLNM